MEEDNIVNVTEEHIQQPAPRVVYAVSAINEALYPETENGESADDESTDEESTDDETADETNADEESTDDETNDGGANDDEATDPVPGFGIAAALAALLTVVALRRR
ncbi:PGF-CTERM sorting domain-containing protein [Natronoarchaeum sp. GCM10025703]